MAKMCNATIDMIQSDYPALKIADDCPVCNRKIGFHGKGAFGNDLVGLALRKEYLRNCKVLYYASVRIICFLWSNVFVSLKSSISLIS